MIWKNLWPQYTTDDKSIENLNNISKEITNVEDGSLTNSTLIELFNLLNQPDEDKETSNIASSRKKFTDFIGKAAKGF